MLFGTTAFAMDSAAEAIATTTARTGETATFTRFLSGKRIAFDVACLRGEAGRLRAAALVWAMLDRLALQASYLLAKSATGAAMRETRSLSGSTTSRIGSVGGGALSGLGVGAGLHVMVGELRYVILWMILSFIFGAKNKEEEDEKFLTGIFVVSGSRGYWYLSFVFIMDSHYRST